MTNLQNLVDLYRIVKVAQHDHCPMPDSVCDALYAALQKIEGEVVAAPTTCPEDVKAKFEFVSLALDTDCFLGNREMEIVDSAYEAARVQRDMDVQELMGKAS